MKTLLIIKLKQAKNGQWYMIGLDNEVIGDFLKAGNAYIAWFAPEGHISYKVDDAIKVPEEALKLLE